MIKKLIIITGIPLLVWGCGAKPNLIALDPPHPQITQVIASPQSVEIDTVDIRKANFIVRYKDGDKAARLVSPVESPRIQLDQVLQGSFKQAGYRVVPAAPKHIEFQLEELLMDVDEGSFKYDAQTTIIINAIAKNGDQVLTKRYQGKNKFDGAFGADFASLELELNKLLGEVTANIVNDPELNDFMQK